MAIAVGRNRIWPWANNQFQKSSDIIPYDVITRLCTRDLAKCGRSQGKHSRAFNNFRRHIGDVSVAGPFRASDQRKSGACLRSLQIEVGELREANTSFNL